MSDPKSVLPPSVTEYAAAPTAAPDRRVLAVGSVLALATVAFIVALLILRPGAPTPMALDAAPPPPATATAAPTATASPTPPPMIAVGFTPGARDQVIPAGAAVTHLGPVELVNGETECYVAYEGAQVWGPCAALGYPDAPPPTPTRVPAPPAPAPRPAAPAWSPPPIVAPPPPAPAPEPAPEPAPVGDQAKPCTHPRCMP